MKKLFICILITIGLSYYTIGQDYLLENSIIFIDGKMWISYNQPIEQNSELYHSLLKILPKGRSIMLDNNLDGFTCYWNIKNEKLYLDRVTVTFINNRRIGKCYERCISSANMHRIFKEYYDKDGIFAAWTNGTIRFVRGEGLWYEAINYEQEQMITLKQGQIIERQSFHNRLVIDGFSLNDLWYQGQEEVKAKLPLKLDDYPELNDENSLEFFISPIQVDSLGNLVDCKVQAFIWRQGERQEIEKLSDQMKNLLKNIYPWKTYLINGQYISRDNDGGIYPYWTRVDINNDN